MDAKLGTKPHNIDAYVAGPPQTNAAFWENLTKMLGTIIVALQNQQPHEQQLGSTNSFQKGRRDNYNGYELTALMGYDNVFNTSDIPRIWGKFHQSKELADNRQELEKVIEC